MTATQTLNQAPMMTCPYCAMEWQHDDLYRVSVGSTITCQHCEKEADVTEVETVLWIRLDVTQAHPQAKP